MWVTPGYGVRMLPGMRWLPVLLLAACAAPVDPDRPDIHGKATDPSFCVNVEADGRRYTANDARPNAVQAAAGVEQGRYPYPATCIADP